MPDDSQKSGGQQYSGQDSEELDKSGQKKEKKEAGDYATNIWHKIKEGAAAKDKITNLKDEIKPNLQSGEVIHKKRRRRRRRKKRGLDAMPQANIPSQDVKHELKPKHEEEVKLSSKIEHAEKPRHEEKGKPEVKIEAKIDHKEKPKYEEMLKPETKPEHAVFEDSDEKDELPNAQFSDENEVLEEALDPKKNEVPEKSQVLEENEVPEKSRVPEENEVPEKSQVPEENEVPEEPNVPKEIQPGEGVQPPQEAQIHNEMQPPQPPNELPPNTSVAPINPFDFGPPNTTVTPNSPAYREKNRNFSNPFENDKAVQTNDENRVINPFDLTGSASSVEDKKDADASHHVVSSDQGIYEDIVSPEESGESDEFQSINVQGDGEKSDADQQGAVVDKEDEVIEVLPEDVQEKKIDPVFPEKIEEQNNQEIPVREDFWTVLEHAGITKKKLIIFGAILLLIIFIALFFIFGGMSLFSGTKTVARPDQSVQKEIPDSVSEERPYDVISSYIFGLEYNPLVGSGTSTLVSFGEIAGVDASLIFGTVVNLKLQQFVEYEQILEKMNNIYNVDLYSMLDRTVDRRVALDKYLRDMDALIQECTTALANIEVALVQFKTQYESYSKQSSSYEAAFFNYSKNYYGQTAYDNLQLFIDTSSQASRIKAEYAAINNLKKMFLNSLAALKPKYQDISANTEALLKGVRVFDIKNSDINAIVPLK